MLFEVIGQPQGKQRARVTIRGGFAKAYTPEKTASYENLIMLSFVTALHGNKTPFWECPLEIKIKAFYAIPKSFSKKKQQAAIDSQIRPTTKPDIDNVVKCVCDALNARFAQPTTAGCFARETPTIQITFSFAGETAQATQIRRISAF